MAFKIVNGKLVKTTKTTRASEAAHITFNEYLAQGKIVHVGNGNYMLRNPDPYAPKNLLDEVAFTKAAILENMDRHAKQDSKFSKLH